MSTSPSYPFTVAGSRTLVAIFDEAFVITTSSSPGVGGTTEMDSATYKTGENARAKAFPAVGCSFANWTVNGVVVSTNDTYTFNVTGNRGLVGNFLSNTGATITTTSSPAAGGTTSGAGAYGVGDSVTVSAVPNAGSGFVNWTQGGAVVGTDLGYTFIASTSRALVANFIAPPPLALTPGGPGSNVMVLSWPAADAGWVLQESADLVTWVNSIRSATVVGGQKSITARTTGASCFFRLAHP